MRKHREFALTDLFAFITPSLFLQFCSDLSICSSDMFSHVTRRLGHDARWAD